MNNIPKICHLIWTKEAKMSYLQALTVKSFKKYNPDWTIMVHLEMQTDSEMADNTYVPLYTLEEDYFPSIINDVVICPVDLKEENISLDKPAIVLSDQLRLNILKKHGGIYSDFDVIWLKPMEHFHNVEHIGNLNNFDFMFCLSNYTSGYHNVSVLMSPQNSPIVNNIIEEQNKIKPPYGHQDFGTTLYNKMFPSVNLVKNKLLVKYETIFPYSIFNMDALYNNDNLSYLNDNVMCVHWFNGHHLSKKYVNNKEYNRPCSMTSILNKENLNYLF